MKRLTFTRWLALQKNRDDAIGDLASDVARDRDWHDSNRLTLGDRIAYLRVKGACDDAIRALQDAWREWKYAGS